MAASHPYAQVLGDHDPLKVLTETHERIPAIARALAPEGMQRSYAAGKWTAAQVLSHLADCEVAFGFRVRQVISEPQLTIQPFDQDQWARHYDRIDGLKAAEAFQALRTWNLMLFQLLSKEELQRTANHPERGPESADTVIRIMAGHTLHHLAQLESIPRGK